MTSRLRILLLLCVATACSRPRAVAPAPAPQGAVPPDTREASLFAAAVKHGTRTTTGVPGPNYWQQTAHYRIQATLDPQAQTLSGTETVMYVNRSPDTLTSLAIDLYQNINAAGAPRDQPVPTTSGLQLARVAAQGVTLQPQTTDSAVGYRVVNTIGRIQLPRQMLPGDSAELAFTWSFRIPPKSNPRMGTDGGVFVLGYWYPQVAVYDDVAGWDTDPYVSRGEFYMDYGDYDVRITAPDNQLIAATGTLDNPEEVLTEQTRSRLAEAKRSGQLTSVVTKGDRGAGRATRSGTGGKLTWHFHATNVRDFAWAASKDYLWDATGARVGNRDGRGTVDSTMIYAFYRPSELAWTKSSVYLKQSIEFLSNLLWPYPYPHMTAVEGFVSGGMEFPMLTHIGGVQNGNELYLVTVHETSHMWFPMLVGSDETRFAWMDEGLASYNEALGVREFLGFDEQRAQQRQYLLDHERGVDEPLMVHADAYPNDDAYQEASYVKPVVVMRALRGVLGDSVFLRAYREYGRRWTNKHPRPEDFFNTFNDVSGQDLSWFWKAWFFGTGTLDQAVEEMKVVGDSSRIVIANLGENPMPVLLAVTRADHSVQHLTIPVDAWLHGAKRDTVMVRNVPAVTRVEIDPDGWFPDVNPMNNSKGSGTPKLPERIQRRPGRPPRP